MYRRMSWALVTSFANFFASGIHVLLVINCSFWSTCALGAEQHEPYPSPLRTVYFGIPSSARAPVFDLADNLPQHIYIRLRTKNRRMKFFKRGNESAAYKFSTS